MATISGFGVRERLPAVPTDRRQNPYDLIHLLGRQQRSAGPRVAWLAAALPAG